MHGDKCNRIHNKPMISQTIMFKHLYQNPPAAIAYAKGSKLNDEDLREVVKHLEKFYEAIFIELSNFGEIKELRIVDNLNEHLIGNVYVRFNDEASASKAFNALAGKYYQSNLVQEEYCPFTKITDGRCQRYEQGICTRGCMCNFLHFKPINKALIQSLRQEMYENHPEYRNNRNNFFKNKRYYHEHSSSNSSLDEFDNEKRKRIIEKWNAKYQVKKELEEKQKRDAQSKIYSEIIQQKLKMSKRYDEDRKMDNYRIDRKRQKYADSDEETISKEDL